MRKKFRKINFIILFFLVIFNFFFLSQKILSQTENQTVFLAKVEGEIKVGTYQYLKRTIKISEKERADYLIIKLDTPGGLLKATKDIVDLILATKIKTIIFVFKEGGWAYSAGTFILLAGDYAIVHPQASIGSAQPREMRISEKKIDPKIIEGVASWMRSLAERNQRNSKIAEKFVRENLTLTGKEAKEAKIVDETAKNLNELFLKLNITEPKIKEIFPTPIERFFDLLSHPYLISLFLTLGSLSLIFAIKSGEFELAGILGILFLLIGLWGIGIIEFSHFGILLILLGVFLLTLEVFEPGFGFFGLFGTISLILGIFTFEAEPFFSPRIFGAISMFVFGTIFTFAILFVIITKGVVKSLKEKPKAGPEALIGQRALVLKTLDPLGQVKIKGEIWRAKSFNGKVIRKNSKVKIIKVEGNTLYVKLC